MDTKTTTEIVNFAQKELGKIDSNQQLQIIQETRLVICDMLEQAENALKESENFTRKATAHADRGIGTKIWEMLPGTTTGAEKQARLNTEAIMETNKAISFIAKIQQETIKFFTSSYEMSMAAYMLLSEAMANGFEGRDGEMIELKGKKKELALQLQSTIGNMITQRMETKKELEFIESRLDEKDDLDERQSQQIQSNAERIQINLESIEQLKARKQEILERLEQKSQIDDAQEQRISQNTNSINDLYQQVGQIRGALSKLPMIISIVALIASLASLTLSLD
ncbi:hypothetical protein BKN38_05775 [Helicobacter sp. CLO-3]|uniref:hypothetical protein n=1 Tax=unclassified Helicobacter TaxID=2593540 RepID=UPI0008051E96|nr:MULTISPECIES: hypothetical protein [unclassified Helicobacter]OBV29967.1 hypothetical protein BA723_03175 [Helicobacter sp. CLO-3]OHU83213.1 hypothetical protein BKN38_05775 [Helicobacter sp. CLO-3]